MGNFKSVIDFVIQVADMLSERAIKFIPGNGAACVLSVGHPDAPSVVVLLSIDPDEVWQYITPTQRHSFIKYDMDSSIEVDRFIRDGQLRPLLATTTASICLNAQLLACALSALQDAGVPLDNVAIRCGAFSESRGALLLHVFGEVWEAQVAICGDVLIPGVRGKTGGLKFNGIPLTDENYKTLFFREHILEEEDDEEEDLISAANVPSDDEEL